MNDQFFKDAVLFTTIFVGSSVGGWAQMMWEGKPIPTAQKVGGVLLSGLAGTIVALLLWGHMADNRALLVGVSLLSGIGGASTLDWVAGVIKKKFGRGPE